MLRNAIAAGAVALVLAVPTAGIAAGQPAPARPPSPGSVGIGDPYFPRDGNGGYDAKRYRLKVRYHPESNRLAGRAAIRARATKNLSRFNLDLRGLTVRSIRVNGRSASWRRWRDELTVIPRRALHRRQHFTTVVRYAGVPRTLPDGSGFIHTDDGTVVIGEPHVADTWYPVNDHPSDKASYSFRITVPRGLEAVANGRLQGHWTRRGWTTWAWNAKEPMASYLTTATIGEFVLRSYRRAGIRFWDAVDPDLYDPVAAPRTGQRLAVSQQADSSYKRLSRVIDVPAGGADLSFWVTRATEPTWDFLFVEAHTVGEDDWTTLRDANGHSSADTGSVCPFWLDIHPFLRHYQTGNGDGTCSPTGTTGEWWAASGGSDGYEQWSVDLSAYAGSRVEVSITYASDDVVQLPGVFVDDIVVSTGAGTTSFEADGDVFDGWTAAGPPPGSPGNDNNWIAGTAADVPPPPGEVVDASFGRHGEIIRFLQSKFGRYPFTTSGGIVDDIAGVGFALENQTRPIYAREFFTDTISGDGVVVHELAHQWYGDSLTVARWRHIWLNEGFATYAEWMWSEREGLGTEQEIFDFFYGAIPADDPFWTVVIGDPGPENLFDFAVYARGAMTLHRLRQVVGDRDFFTILRRWAAIHEDGNVRTRQFLRLAERISGRQLDRLFDVWLFTPRKPAMTWSATARSTAGGLAAAPAVAQNLVRRDGAARLLFGADR